MAVDDLVTAQRWFGPVETVRRWRRRSESRGMTVFVHIDHTAGPRRGVIDACRGHSLGV